MYAHGTRAPIRQPPHTAGRGLKGFRNAIDLSQVPSPVDAIEADRDKWDGQVFDTLPSQDGHAPLSTTDFIALDQGNANPKFARPTTWSMPASARLARECAIPLAVVIQPFADLDRHEEPVPLVQTGDLGPARCSGCRGYVNPWCTWLAGGQKWRCNLCGRETDVEAEYFSHLAPNGYRMDAPNRPELSKGTVDFAVPSPVYRAPLPPPRLLPASSGIVSPSATPSTSSFFSLPAAPLVPERKAASSLDFVFALDLSLDGVRSGFVRSAATAILEMLYGSDSAFPPYSRVAFVTYDATVHFYDLSHSSDRPKMLVVPDIDDVFLPANEGLMVNPLESRTVIENLLGSIINFPEEMVVGQSALGGALRGILALLKGQGGHAVLFHSSLPNVGPGNLDPRVDENSFYESDREREIFAPRHPFWVDIAEECADEGVGVSMFLGMNKFADVGSIGIVANKTGGQLFFYPRYDIIRDAPAMESQLRRLLTRMTGYDVLVRVRVSSGLRLDEHYGNFHQRTEAPDELSLGIVHADTAFSVALSHTAKLSAREHAHIQCAVLYTSVDGERRVRVVNLALNVADLAGTVFRFADMDAVVTHLAKMAVSTLPRKRMDSIREDLSNRCAEILLGYRKNCAVATQPSQLILPEAFKALPMYTLGILKSKPLKGKNVSSDVRNYHIHRILGMGCQSIMNYVYPRVLALHDLDDKIALPDANHEGRIWYPSHTRASYVWMEGHGIYLVDNEEMCIFWVGLSTSPAQLKDLFDIEDINDLDPRLAKLPELSTGLSAQVRNILGERQARRGGKAIKLLLARQNTDGTEIEFGDMLVEDENNANMSYLDFLCHIHRQIHTVLTQGGSIGGNRELSSTPW